MAGNMNNTDQVLVHVCLICSLNEDGAKLIKCPYLENTTVTHGAAKCGLDAIESYHQTTNERSLGGKSLKNAQNGDKRSRLQGTRVHFILTKRLNLCYQSSAVGQGRRSPSDGKLRALQGTACRHTLR